MMVPAQCRPGWSCRIFASIFPDNRALRCRRYTGRCRWCAAGPREKRATPRRVQRQTDRPGKITSPTSVSYDVVVMARAFAEIGFVIKMPGAMGMHLSRRQQPAPTGAGSGRVINRPSPKGGAPADFTEGFFVEKGMRLTCPGRAETIARAAPEPAHHHADVAFVSGAFQRQNRKGRNVSTVIRDTRPMINFPE